jgi:hypothetical protein
VAVAVARTRFGSPSGSLRRRRLGLLGLECQGTRRGFGFPAVLLFPGAGAGAVGHLAAVLNEQPLCAVGEVASLCHFVGVCSIRRSHLDQMIDRVPGEVSIHGGLL